jgi:GTP-binding protein Era
MTDESTDLQDAPDESGRPTAAPPATRAGYVALVGRPNAGKSTLMNQFIGEKLSIVTPKAQTTWQRITGILTDDEAQLVFLDTPGLLQVKDRLQASMLGEAHEALEEADVVLVVIDTDRFRPDRDGPVLTGALEEVSVPVFVALNKVDQARGGRVDAAEEWAIANLTPSDRGGGIHRISALNGAGTAELLAELKSALPESPFFYPEDEIASAPVRFFVSEMVRETVFDQFDEEIPYSVAAQVEEFREGEDPVYIQVTLYVDRNPQKRILIGKGGQAIRDLGRVSRQKIEAFIGRPVYLDLWVKVLPGWRRKVHHLKRLGYRVPDEASSSD